MGTVHPWFPPLHDSQSHDKGTFAKDTTVHIHTIIQGKAAISILPNRDAPHRVRQVHVGFGLEQRRGNSFLARP